MWSEMNRTIEHISKDSIEVEDNKKEYLNKVILSMVSALAKDEPGKQRRVILLTVSEESEGQINQGTKIDNDKTAAIVSQKSILWLTLGRQIRDHFFESRVFKFENCKGNNDGNDAVNWFSVIIYTTRDLEIARQKYSLKNKGYASIKELRRAEMDRQPKCASQKGFGKFLIFI